MASHSIAADQVAKHGITLSADVVDTVTFTGVDVNLVQVYKSSGAAVYLTLDGSAPTVGGANTYMMPTAESIDEFDVPTSGSTVVKLISSGTPTLSVIKRG